MNWSLAFRIFYTTFYTLLLILLIALLLITPGDAIRQALNNSQLYNVFVIAGCYLLTVILAFLIYASRLYTTRSVLAAIPKTWIPIEKGDVGKSVRKMVVESLASSAIIAWNARPRIDETSTETEMKWDIRHDGWSSPAGDMQHIQYMEVILELPHLIEAKAVSLTPSLRRENGPLREYIAYLVDLDVIPESEFINAYERARFAGVALSDVEFAELMGLFAELLRSMRPADPALLSEADDASSIYAPSTTPSARSGSQDTVRTVRRTISRTLQRQPSTTSSLRSYTSSVIRLRPSASSSELPYTLHPEFSRIRT